LITTAGVRVAQGIWARRKSNEIGWRATLCCTGEWREGQQRGADELVHEGPFFQNTHCWALLRKGKLEMRSSKYETNTNVEKAKTRGKERRGGSAKTPEERRGGRGVQGGSRRDARPWRRRGSDSGRSERTEVVRGGAETRREEQLQDCGLLWTYCETARLVWGRGHTRHLCRRLYTTNDGRVQQTFLCHGV
jgi:hypothetical protein